MNKKREKMNLNPVGVAPQGDPYFEEPTKKSSKTHLNLISNLQLLTSDHRGITLIALIITIIVMLILVGVTVNVVINGGLFSTAKEAVEDTQLEADRESLLPAVIGAINDSSEVDFTKLNNNLPEGFTGSDGAYTSKSGNTFYVDEYGNITTGPQVTIAGETVTLTPNNVGEYLGKVVTNYKTGSEATENVTIGSQTYTVSTKYRLYYVDFTNKYKDGAGTVYLKADCTSNNYGIPTTDTTSSENSSIKIRNLNPELYKDGVTSPSASYRTMRAVTYLTNTNNWKDLKEGVNQEVASNINYVVGAPSLEMMMDSYNTHYAYLGCFDLDEKTPNTTTALQGTEARVKLFYKYPYDSNNYGYGVGPWTSSSASEGYYFTTSGYVIKTDPSLDSMYYPGNDYEYWLASPSSYNTHGVFFLSYTWRWGC